MHDDIPDLPALPDPLPPEGRISKRARNYAREMKDMRAMQLRAMGYSWKQIADQLGYSSGRFCQKRVQQLADKLSVTNTREWRQYEISLLNIGIQTLIKAVLYSDYKVTPRGEVARGPDGEFLRDYTVNVQAADTLRRLSESRRRVLGTDAPVQQHITVEERTMDAEIAAVIQQLRKSAPPPAIENTVEAEIISDTEIPDAESA